MRINFKGRIFISILFLGLIVVLGLTGILVTRTWDPLWNPFRPAPEKVIKKMILEMEKVKTWHDKFEILFTFLNQEMFEARFSGQGKRDINQPEKPKQESVFDLYFSFIEKRSLIDWEFTLTGETKTINEIDYLKLTSFSTMPFLDQIKNQWIKIDKETMLNLEKELMKIKGENWVPELEKIFKEEIEEEKLFKKELEEKIKKILKERNFYLVKKEFSDKKINGIETYHYLIILNNEEILKIISEFSKIIKEIILKQYKTVPPIFNEEEIINQMIRNFLVKIGEIELEIWIDKKNYLLYRIKGKKSFELSKIGKEGKISISLNFESSKFNQPIKIEPPSQYRDLNEVLLPLLIPFLSNENKNY